jgi:biotin transport system substrate-specific component
VFVGPSAGYLVGFPLAALVAGWVVERWSAPVGVAAFAGAILGGVVVMHLCGILGMAVVLGKTLPEAALLAVPFLAGDLLKSAIAAGVTRGLARLRPGALLSRS